VPDVQITARVINRCRHVKGFFRFWHKIIPL
jgi:hypothetical protein